MSPWVWPVVLLAVGLVLLVLEFFVPSGGILGFLTVVSLVSAVVLAFYQGGPAVGTTMLVIITVALPVVLTLAVRWWPNTPLGRLILLRPPSEDPDELKETDYTRELKKLIGRQGKAASKMLPAGSVKVDGRTYDAVSQGVAIEPGQPIRVVRVEGNCVVVRPVEEGENIAPSPSESPPASHLDQLVEDPFSDPLA